MAFMVNLKEVYIDPADVEAYLTEIANLWQGEEDNYENEAVTSQIMDLSLIHISEPTRRTPISYAVFCLKKKKKQKQPHNDQ